MLEQWFPVHAAIGGFPDTASHGPKDIRIRLAGNAGDGQRASATKRPDVAPMHSAKKFLVIGLSGEGECCEGKQEEQAHSSHAEGLPRGSEKRTTILHCMGEKLHEVDARRRATSSLAPYLLAALQRAIKELLGRSVGPYPVSPNQETMNLVRNNQLLKGDMLLAWPLRQVNRLAERYVAIIVAVDEKHWRFPRAYVRIGRRFPSHLYRFF